MAKVDQREMGLGLLYGRALLEVAEEQGCAEEVAEQLVVLCTQLDEDESLRRFVSSPLVDAAARRLVLEKALRGRFLDVLVDGLQVVSRKGRLAFLDAIAAGYHDALWELRGRVDVAVRTAVPLSEEQRVALRAAAARITEREPRLHEAVDSSLLGGMILQVGDTVMDHSVAGELARRRARLLERASQEIHGAQG